MQVYKMKNNGINNRELDRKLETLIRDKTSAENSEDSKGDSKQSGDNPEGSKQREFGKLQQLKSQPK